MDAKDKSDAERIETLKKSKLNYCMICDRTTWRKPDGSCWECEERKRKEAERNRAAGI